MNAFRICLSLLAALLLLLPPSIQAVTPRPLTVERVSEDDTLVAITANQTRFSIRPLGIHGHDIAHGTEPRMYDLKGGLR